MLLEGDASVIFVGALGSCLAECMQTTESVYASSRASTTNNPSRSCCDDDNAHTRSVSPVVPSVTL